jgi:hypothetical protein
VADDKDEVAAKRGQPKQDKAKAKEHYEKLAEEVGKDKGKPK